MWNWAALMPHAPILHEEVAGAMMKRCLHTVKGIKKLISKINLNSTSYIFLLDPHAYYYKLGYLAVEFADLYEGSLANFGAPALKVEAHGAKDEGENVLTHLAKNIPISVHKKTVYPLDHGAVVPLAFFGKNYGTLPKLLVVNPLGLSLVDAYRLGEHLRTYVSKEKWALLASGDLSHTLTPDAPAGYTKEGAILDKAVIASLESSSPEPIFRLSKQTIIKAGECGLKSVLTLLGLVSGEKIKVMSYEGPFGVGYCIALWESSQSDGE